jgi:hypothetical protein
VGSYTNTKKIRSEYEKMPVYFGLWEQNLNIPPSPNPADNVKQFEGFLALMKAQLQSGVLKEVHGFLEGTRGYFITGDVSDEQVFEALQTWIPFVTFEVHRTVPFPRALELTLNAVKKLAG